jgi:hypothetical protein
MSIRSFWTKRRGEMKWKARSGIVLVITLAIGWVAHEKVTVPPPPKEGVREAVLEERKRHATMGEKRENRRIAKTYASAGWGWRGREWKCLNYLWSSESRFDHYADNPTSSAYGIAQRLGEDSRRPRVQILRGLRYIDHRYDTPCRAWAFWLRNYHY